MEKILFEPKKILKIDKTQFGKTIRFIFSKCRVIFYSAADKNGDYKDIVRIQHFG